MRKGYKVRETGRKEGGRYANRVHDKMGELKRKGNRAGKGIGKKEL